MIEVVNLKKYYKNKGGNQVKALDGISLKFPDKGMVFLLGKSGSGKSTLLNVCGGLDSPTDGEIIVKGRSSKKFTRNDFDSYRNTYVGFVFQEYNILNEFSVENNIALALELQGKPKDKESVANLLKEVDLDGYGHRKPNTLSGGQKQRIAIARALIKNPEIIMADEPTGALDSNTGKQVFDTLKKLSKDKLVIVVSHDREFAEQYADRIIELKDGKVLSDVSKIEEKREQLNDNVSVVGDSVLCVNDGESLKEEDFKFIKDFLKKNKNAIICSDEHDLKNVKKAAKINDKGYKESFENTTDEKIDRKTYTKEEAKFIRSRLPMKHAIAIGASGLKTKPFKLLMTIFLCTFAFALFGLLSTMMLYDGDAVFTESMMKSNYNYLQLVKEYNVKENYYEGEVLVDSYNYFETTKLTETELEEHKKKYGENTFGAIEVNMDVSNTSSKTGSYSYYSTLVRHLAVIDKTNSLYNMLSGTYPTKANEIAISSYLADSIVYTGLYNKKTDKKYTIKGSSDILGKNIVLGRNEYTVVGIFDSGMMPTKYEALKEGGAQNWSLTYEFEQELSNGLYQLAFVSEAGMKALKPSYDSLYRIFNSLGDMYIGNDNMHTVPNYGKYKGNESLFSVEYFNSKNTSVEDDEVVLTGTALYNVLENNYSKLSSKYKNEWEFNLRWKASELLISYSYDNTVLSAKKYTSYKNELMKFIKNSGILDSAVTVKLYDQYNGKPISGFSKKLKVIGYFEAEMDLALISDEMYAEFEKKAKELLAKNGSSYSEYEIDYIAPADAKYDVIYLAYDRSLEKTTSLLPYAVSSYDEDKTAKERNRLSNMLVEEVIMVNETVDEFSKVFLYAGLIMAAFAALLLSNFIATSISAKTREIGILRAVGARSVDVFKIFFSESFIITAICIVLSVVGGIVVCGLLNNVISEMLDVTLFVFGIVSILSLVIGALLTTVIATFLPVRKAARKKPVDSIRAI